MSFGSLQNARSELRKDLQFPSSYLLKSIFHVLTLLRNIDFTLKHCHLKSILHQTIVMLRKFKLLIDVHLHFATLTSEEAN